MEKKGFDLISPSPHLITQIPSPRVMQATVIHEAVQKWEETTESGFIDQLPEKLPALLPCQQLCAALCGMEMTGHPEGQGRRLLTISTQT